MINIAAMARLLRGLFIVFAASISWTCFAQPTITGGPDDLTVNVGDTATFSVTATGSGPLSYQWRKNGDNITGAYSSSYTITNVQTSDAAGYYCQVSDSNGPAWSGTAHLTVNSPGVAPHFTAQSGDQTVNAGASVTFSVTASGTEPIAYQWRKNGDDIPGANASSYTISNAQSGDAAGYYCQASNAYGVDWSGTVTLTVNDSNLPAHMTGQSGASGTQTAPLGGSVTFSVTASGTEPIAYQWRKNGDNIAGATSSSYTISNVQSSDVAGYYCQASNAYGVDWSGTVNLQIDDQTVPPNITAQPQSQTVNAGSTATFSVTATGTPSPTYQWRKGGSNIANATQASYSISNAQTGDQGSYDVVVSNSSGTQTSTAATLAVITQPTFNPPGGNFATPPAVQLQTTTTNGVIHYTTDGSAATASSAVYGSPIQLGTGTTVINAVTTLNSVTSSMASATYNVSATTVANPSISPASDTYASPLTVTISCATNGATIHYTTDGTTPTSSSPAYSQPITLTQSATVSAMATLAGYNDSNIASATYTVTTGDGGGAQVQTSLLPGSYRTMQVVKLTTSPSGWTIYYTTDGSTPTTSSTPYTTPITAGNGTTTIKAIGVSGSQTTPIVAFQYSIPGTPVDTLDSNPLALPEVGLEQARVLTPNLVELKFYNTLDDLPAHERPGNATFQQPAQWGGWFSDNPVWNGDWTYTKSFTAPDGSLFPITVNGTVYNATVLGAKRRTRYANYAGTDLRIENSLYLQYGVNLNGQAATIADNTRGIAALNVVTDPYRISPAIHVNQEGYPVSLTLEPSGTPSPKRARIGYYMGNGGDAAGQNELNIGDNTPFTIVDAGDHSHVVFPAGGATAYLTKITEEGWTNNGYQNVYEANFDTLTTPGTYQLVVPGLGASLPFRIDDRMPMGLKRTYAMGLYAQRCGTSIDMPYTRFTHGICHDETVSIPWDAVNNNSNGWDGGPGSVWDTLKNESIARVNQSQDGWDIPQQTAPSFTSDPAHQLTHFVTSVPSHTIYDDHPELRNDGLQGYKSSSSDTTHVDVNVELYHLSGSTVTVDIKGGHHDAGDYSKYTINSADLVHVLMTTVDYVAGGRATNLGIPESDGSVPDLLVEAKWEADCLAKMQDPSDGGFYALVYPANGAATEAGPPDHAKTDHIYQVVWPKNTSSTAAAIAALAECASSQAFQQAYPNDAIKYARQAKAGWWFLKNQFQQVGGSMASPDSCAAAYQKLYFYGDDWCHNDEVAWAAAELYLLTGDSEYAQALTTWMPNPADTHTYHYGWDPMSMRWGNAIRSIALAAHATAQAQPYRHVGQIRTDLQSSYVDACGTEMFKKADLEADATLGDANGTNRSAYGTSITQHEKLNSGIGWYFSSSRAADLAIAFGLIDPADTNRQKRYLEAMLDNVNYELGCNPVNMSFVAGIGQRRPREYVNQYAESDARVLPPTGIPIGNIGAPYERWWFYGYALDRLTFPEDHPIDGSTPYGFYDRFTDANNTQNEFVTVNIARSLATLTLLASGTSANTDPRARASDSIQVSSQAASSSTPGRLTMTTANAADQSGTESLSDARVVWELDNGGVYLGPSVDLTGPAASSKWYEVEVAWPDGKRTVSNGSLTPVVQTTNLWVDDSRPGTYGGGDELTTDGATNFLWSSTPTPISGLLCHVSPAAAGEHGHGFNDASGLTFNGGDTLFTYAYIDPANRPTEIMVVWWTSAGKFAAYWNGQSTPIMTDQSQYTTAAVYEGPVPTQSGWVRLEMSTPANLGSNVQVQKLFFYHYDGGLWWDAAGKYTP
jgi:hypothetical protein